jgi:hypothetical protein
MRYEAYHNIAKRLAQVNFNFKNITLSVANHTISQMLLNAIGGLI